MAGTGIPFESRIFVASSIEVVCTFSFDLHMYMLASVSHAGEMETLMTHRCHRARPAVVRRRLLQTRLVVAGRPPPNTERLSSSKSDCAYAARSACSASARAFLDVRGVLAIAGVAADLGGIALVAGCLGAGVEGEVGRALAGTRKSGGITAALSASGRVFSTSDTVSVDNDENSRTRL